MQIEYLENDFAVQREWRKGRGGEGRKKKVWEADGRWGRKRGNETEKGNNNNPFALRMLTFVDIFLKRRQLKGCCSSL